MVWFVLGVCVSSLCLNVLFLLSCMRVVCVFRFFAMTLHLLCGVYCCCVFGVLVVICVWSFCAVFLMYKCVRCVCVVSICLIKCGVCVVFMICLLCFVSVVVCCCCSCFVCLIAVCVVGVLFCSCVVYLRLFMCF